jgi:RNA polymerase sigma factor (sigma-70 family)
MLGSLGRLFARGTVTGLSEDELLDRFVVEHDEAAFAALVARHGPMVLGVCRRILRDERDVEDAFQATFLILVRRAGAIRDGRLLGRWLHGVAHRVAVRSHARAARRYTHERPVTGDFEAVGHSPPQIAGERELSAVLDEELARLPGALRSPMVLCYLEGLTHDEAASRLGWPVGTVRSRMARARDLLHRRLSRRGIMASGAVLPGSMAKTTVPIALIDSTVRMSLVFLTKQSLAVTVASLTAAGLANEVLHAMMLTRLTVLGATGLTCVLALGGPSLARQFTRIDRDGVRTEQEAGPIQIALAEPPPSPPFETNTSSEGQTKKKPDTDDSLEAEYAAFRAEYIRTQFQIDALSKQQAANKERSERIHGDLKKSQEMLEQLKLKYDATSKKIADMKVHTQSIIDELNRTTRPDALDLVKRGTDQTLEPKQDHVAADIWVDVFEMRRHVDVGGETSFVIRLRNYGENDASRLRVICRFSENLEVLEITGGPATNDLHLREKDGDEIRFSEIAHLGVYKEIKLGVKVRVKNTRSRCAYCRVSVTHDDFIEPVEGIKDIIVPRPKGAS